MKIKLIDISNMESIGFAGVMPYQTPIKWLFWEGDLEKVGAHD